MQECDNPGDCVTIRTAYARPNRARHACPARVPPLATHTGERSSSLTARPKHELCQFQRMTEVRGAPCFSQADRRPHAHAWVISCPIYGSRMQAYWAAGDHRFAALTIAGVIGDPARFPAGRHHLHGKAGYRHMVEVAVAVPRGAGVSRRLGELDVLPSKPPSRLISGPIQERGESQPWSMSGRTWMYRNQKNKHGQTIIWKSDTPDKQGTGDIRSLEILRRRAYGLESRRSPALSGRPAPVPQRISD